MRLRPRLLGVSLLAVLLPLLGCAAGVRGHSPRAAPLEARRARTRERPARLGAAVTGSVVHRISFFSRELHARRSYLIDLPPDYSAGAAHGRRYPVLYLLHAPPGSPDGFLTAGHLRERADGLIAAHAVGPFLAVMPDGRSTGFRNDTEWADAGAGRYESFVLDAVRSVDARWATDARRGARVIAGVSEGGYGAVNIALHHLDAFGAAESWSGYFTQTPTGPFAGSSPHALRTNSPSAYVGSLRAELGRRPLRAFLYQGTLDDVPAADMADFARRLRAAGGRVRTVVAPGGHSWRLWAAELPRMLRFADASFRAADAGRLSGPSGGGSPSR